MPEDSKAEAEQKETASVAVSPSKDSKQPAASPKSPAKPKAKAKAKAKTKAKTSQMKKPSAAKTPPKSPKSMKKQPVAKQTAKSKKNNASGKPSDPAQSTEPKEPKTPKKSPKKRPAGRPATPTGKAGKSSWKQGLSKKEKEEETEQQQEGEEEEDFERDPEIDFDLPPQDDSEKMDRCKKQKFLAMVASKQLPEFLQKEWEKSKAMKVGRTSHQRSLINSAFDRSQAGKLILSLQKPMFESMKASYKDTSTTDLSKSLTRSLFQGKFSLSDELFERGLAAGDFTEVIDNKGRKAYMWETAIHKVKQGDKQQHGFSAGFQGEKGDVEKMENLKANWKLGLFKKNPSSGSRPLTGGAPNQLMLCDDAPLDEEQWQSAQGQFKPAMDAFDKCEKDGLKMLNAIGPENRDDPLIGNLTLGCKQFTQVKSEKLF